MRILVIEDEKKTAAFLAKGLREAGFVVDLALDGEAGLAAARASRFELLIVDIMLPKKDGWALVEELRAAKVQTPVIFLTARDGVRDRVKGLELGADDYVVKPFGLTELFEVVARVNRFLDTKSGYLRKMEEEKFTTLRGAANTVCHEINNPLTSIVGAARLLAKRVTESGQLSDLKSEMETILEAAQRIHNITHQLARAIRVVTTEPVPGVKMIDLQASSKRD